ncbi:hypothetical protein, partial, partial [Parasitella parasitica]
LPDFSVHRQEDGNKVAGKQDQGSQAATLAIPKSNMKIIQMDGKLAGYEGSDDSNSRRNIVLYLLRTEGFSQISSEK